MLRIFLIIALVGGLAAAGISGYFVRNNMMQAVADRNDYLDHWHQETKAKNDALAKLKTANDSLAATKTKLGQTEAALTTANGKISDLDAQNKDLTANLNKTKVERDTAQQDLEKWRQIGLEPEQVKGVIADLEKARKENTAEIAENKLLAASSDSWKRKYENLVGVRETVVEPPGLKGKILDVDPKFGFVILDIGSDNGVLARGDMLVARDGKFVGKVHIVTVEKNRSIANILPDWKRGNIDEDCTVID